MGALIDILFGMKRAKLESIFEYGWGVRGGSFLGGGGVGGFFCIVGMCTLWYSCVEGVLRG